LPQPTKVRATTPAMIQVRRAATVRISRVVIVQEEIRFSWWPNLHFAPRPLDMTEDEWTIILAAAICEETIKPSFLTKLIEKVTAKAVEQTGEQVLA
jgi:hypothetical protein